jgi:hypothetical protein
LFIIEMFGLRRFELTVLSAPLLDPEVEQQGTNQDRMGHPNPPRQKVNT